MGNLRHLILHQPDPPVESAAFDAFLSTVETWICPDTTWRLLCPGRLWGQMVNLNTLTLDHNLIDHTSAGLR